jgi:hypothetical protein
MDYIILFGVGVGADVVLCATCDGLFGVCSCANFVLLDDLGCTRDESSFHPERTTASVLYSTIHRRDLASVAGVGMGIQFCNLYYLVSCLIVKVKKRFL